MGNSWIIYDNSCSKENTRSVKTAEVTFYTLINTELSTIFIYPHDTST